jgi:hypothetical protein
LFVEKTSERREMVRLFLRSSRRRRQKEEDEDEEGGEKD